MINELKTASLICFLAVCLMACTKKETQSVDNETQSVVDNAIADQEFMSLVPAAQLLSLKTRGAAKTTAGSCDTLTRLSGDTLWGTAGHVDPTYSMAVSASACNLTLPDGKTRSGKLLIRLTNRVRTAGAKMIIKMLDYKASNVVHTCDSIMVTTVSSNTQFTEFNVKLLNGQVFNPNGTIKYSFDRTVKNYFSGNPAGTEPFTSTYGATNGVNSQGRVFTVNIPSSSPLVKHRNCQYIEKGMLELTPEGYKVRTVDFGNGTCDDEATFSVNDNTITFKLK